MPRVFDQGNGDVAEGRRELGANPSPSNLLVDIVAFPENTRVQCKGDNGGDVGRVKGALCGMFCVVPANVRVMERVAGGLGVHGQSASGLLSVPLLNHGVDRIDEAVLGHGVEETEEVIVGCVKGDVCGCLGEVAVETAPKLWDGKLPWMLWKKAL